MSYFHPQKFLQHLLMVALFVSTACTFNSLPTINGPSNFSTGAQSANGSGVRKREQIPGYLGPAQRKAKLANLKIDTHKPLKVSIDPGLNNANSTVKPLDLSDYVNQTGLFQTLRVPSGRIVFQETFTKGRQPLEVIRNFRIDDTTQRYTLHVQKNGRHSLFEHASVNINGTDWIKPQDMLLKSELERNTLLLNANNSLRVRVQGKPGASITVTLVEGGEAGTVLKRRGFLGLPHETQQSHVRQNDVNIFNPDHEDSLGQLEPYNSPKTETTGYLPVVEAVINGESFHIQSNVLLLEFENSETDLPLFLNRYDARIQNIQDVPELDIKSYSIVVNPNTLPR